MTYFRGDGYGKKKRNRGTNPSTRDATLSVYAATRVLDAPGGLCVLGGENDPACIRRGIACLWLLLAQSRPACVRTGTPQTRGNPIRIDFRNGVFEATIRNNNNYEWHQSRMCSANTRICSELTVTRNIMLFRPLYRVMPVLPTRIHNFNL